MLLEALLCNISQTKMGPVRQHKIDPAPSRHTKLSDSLYVILCVLAIAIAMHAGHLEAAGLKRVWKGSSYSIGTYRTRAPRKLSLATILLIDRVLLARAARASLPEYTHIIGCSEE